MDAHVAITEIHYSKEPGKPGDKSKGIMPVRPVTGVIKAGTVFIPKDEEQRREFVDSGAARKFEGNLPEGSMTFAGDDGSAIVSGPNAGTLKRAETAARRQAEADAKGLAALQEEFEQVVGEKPRGNMKAETLQRRIEEVRAEQEKGGPGKKEGAPNASGMTEVAGSSMGDTSAPAAEQVQPDGTSPKSGERTGNDGLGDEKAAKKAEKKAEKDGEDLV